MLRGYRSFETFKEVFHSLVKVPLKERKLPNIENFVKKYGHVATREVAEVFGLNLEETRKRLQELDKTGIIREIHLGNGSFWEPA